MVPNVPIRMFKVRAAHPFKKEQKKTNLITSHHIGISTHFLPCVTLHKRQRLAE